MRLIDADKFKGKVIASHCYSGVNKLINVDDVPTAYDVGRVVEQLETEDSKIEIQYENNYEKGISDGIGKAIEIVKAGGSDE